jgi:hypothetical protein
LAMRIDLIKLSMVPRELEYALRHCDAEEFPTLLDIVIGKPEFGPRTPQDRDLAEYLKEKWSVARERGDKMAELKWRAVIAQLTSQRVGKDHSRLPFGNAMQKGPLSNANGRLLISPILPCWTENQRPLHMKLSKQQGKRLSRPKNKG